MYGAVRRRDRTGSTPAAGIAVRSRLRPGGVLRRPLADNAETLGEPYLRHLGGKVRELRFPLRRQQVRVAYWLASGRRVILLTVFNKTQRSEVAEVDRALAVQKECEAEHGHAVDVYDRRSSDE